MQMKGANPKEILLSMEVMVIQKMDASNAGTRNAIAASTQSSKIHLKTKHVDR